MSPLLLILRSLLHHWRANAAVAAGVAVGTAVLIGALLVGDSMRGSLTRLAVDRLGRVDEALVTEHFFGASLAEKVSGTSTNDCPAAPVIMLQTAVAAADSDAPRQVANVKLIGSDERFWRLGKGGLKSPLPAKQIALNQPLADRLGVRPGDAVLLRLPKQSAIPADSALGRKRETIRSQRVTVREIIPATGLGRFGLQPTQQEPLLAYVSLAWLQEQLEQPWRVNAILLAGRSGGDLRPDLSDYGLHVEQSPLGYFSITSDRMLIDPSAEQAIRGALSADGIHAAAQPALTYLANTMECNGRQVPYSTITAIDFQWQSPLGPFLSVAGIPLPPLADDEIALNAWTADSLKAQIGDTIRVTYFEPESSDGEVREKTVSLRLAAIVALSGAAADRTLTPPVKGITDELTMSDWDPPFPFDAKRIRPADEEYWNRYGPTPKAFVALPTGQRLWGSRFGKITSLRSSKDPTAPLQQHLAPAAMGFVFQPVRQQALNAASGTTPFGVLFLCLSFFLIASAVLLVAILFRLGLEQRTREIGTFLALGFTPRQTGRLLLMEGVIVAAMGSGLGVPLGVGYAAMLLLGLNTWWLGAVGTPFLGLSISPASLAVGSLSGMVIATVVLWRTCALPRKSTPRRMLTGDLAPLEQTLFVPARRTKTLQLALVLLATLPTVVLLVLKLDERLRATMFFLAGSLTLVCLVSLVRLRFKAGMCCDAITPGGGLLRLSLRNMGRHSARSTSTVSLIACATFLIVALSIFRVDPRQGQPSLHSGNGGFTVVADLDQTVTGNLDTREGRAGLGVRPEDEEVLSKCRFFPVRVRAGDDASCLNLYRARQPRILGVSQQFIERGGFRWAESPDNIVNPWQLLSRRLTRDADGVLRVPVVLEKNTANYALQLWGGIGETLDIRDGQNKPVRLEIVALLADSIFQGDLLVSDQAFLEMFPGISGHRMFLVEASTKPLAEVMVSLQQALGDYGPVAETTGRRQAKFLNVQNTYLSAFQSLGALGLLFGTIGIAVVQVRNVLERRSELALLLATGFRRSDLARLVLFEHAGLLLLGVGVGLSAATLAVVPTLVTRGGGLAVLPLAASLVAVVATGLAAGALAVIAAARAAVWSVLREERP